MQRRHFLGALPVGLAAAAAPMALANPPATPVYKGSVDATDFGVVADGVTDNAAAMAQAIDYCVRRELELVLPSGDMVLKSGLTIAAVNGSEGIKIRGTDAGTQGSRLLIQADAPALTIKAQCTLENFGILGDAVTLGAGRGQQDGVLLYGIAPLVPGADGRPTNPGIGNVYLHNMVFDGCQNSIHVFGVVFYSYFENIRWFSCVNAHVNGAGSDPVHDRAGYALQFFQCQMTPNLDGGRYAFYLENAGSLILSDCMMSPANLSENCFRLVSNAQLSGIHQIDNTVFEASKKSALRIDGQGGACRFVFCSNSYFNQGDDSADAIELYDAEHLYFANCYISGKGAGVTFRGRAKRINLANCEFQIAGNLPVVRTVPGAAVHGLDIVAPNYDGGQRFLELGNAVVGEISRIHVCGGTLGIHPKPVNCQPQDANKVMVLNTNNTQTRNGGTAVFSGGASAFAIAHGLLGRPSKFSATPASAAAGDAEIRWVEADETFVRVQCKNAASGEVRWAWQAET